MYTPRAFALDDLPELQQLMHHTRLAQLVTFGEQGLQASHLPLLLNPDEGPNGTLYGHLAKANPQWQDLQNGREALVIFAGADAYVSPAFYPAKAEHGKPGTTSQCMPTAQPTCSRIPHACCRWSAP
ncbi:MAG: Protease synthase and sporulation protein PAI 2 [Pseudomonas fluorescens]|nr:MAG: Protease synthase and sporulation protein PAI 2 [Pseudomonas fluorescens]